MTSLADDINFFIYMNYASTMTVLRGNVGNGLLTHKNDISSLTIDTGRQY